jgi:hypothetical protein
LFRRRKPSWTSWSTCPSVDAVNQLPAQPAIYEYGDSARLKHRLRFSAIRLFLYQRFGFGAQHIDNALIVYIGQTGM